MNMEAELEAHITSLLQDCVTLNILGPQSLHSEYDRFWRCELDFYNDSMSGSDKWACMTCNSPGTISSLIAERRSCAGMLKPE